MEITFREALTPKLLMFSSLPQPIKKHMCGYKAEQAAMKGTEWGRGQRAGTHSEPWNINFWVSWHTAPGGVETSQGLPACGPALNPSLMKNDGRSHGSCWSWRGCGVLHPRGLCAPSWERDTHCAAGDNPRAWVALTAQHIAKHKYSGAPRPGLGVWPQH